MRMEHSDFNILYVNSLYTGTLNNGKICDF